MLINGMSAACRLKVAAAQANYRRRRKQIICGGGAIGAGL